MMEEIRVGSVSDNDPYPPERTIPIWLCLGTRWTHDKEVPAPFYRVGRRGAKDPPNLKMSLPGDEFVFGYSIDNQDDEDVVRSMRISASKHPSVCIDGLSDEEFWLACKRLWENRQ